VATIGQDEVWHNFSFLPVEAAAPNMDTAEGWKSKLQNVLNNYGM
jgi:hypothetical protein